MNELAIAFILVIGILASLAYVNFRVNNLYVKPKGTVGILTFWINTNDFLGKR